MKGEAQVAHVLDTNHFLPPSRHSQLTSFMNLRITDRAEEPAQVSEVLRLSPSLQKRSETRNLVQLRLCPPDSDCQVGDICCCQGFQGVWSKICRSIEIHTLQRNSWVDVEGKRYFLKPMFWEQWWDNVLTLYSGERPDHSDVTDTMITMDTGTRSGIMRSQRCHLRLPDYNEAHWVTWVLSSLRVLASYRSWVSCPGILISAARGGPSQARGILIRLLRYWRRHTTEISDKHG